MAWQEDDPARTVPAPDQPMADVVSDDQGQILFLTDDGRVYLSTLSSGLSSGRLQELALPCQCVIAVAAAEKLSTTHLLWLNSFSVHWEISNSFQPTRASCPVKMPLTFRSAVLPYSKQSSNAIGLDWNPF